MHRHSFQSNDTPLSHHRSQSRNLYPLRHASISISAPNNMHVAIAHLVTPTAIDELREENERLASRLREIVQAEEVVAESVILDGNDPEEQAMSANENEKRSDHNGECRCCSSVGSLFHPLAEPEPDLATGEEKTRLQRDIRFHKNQRKLWLLLCSSVMALILFLSIWVPTERRRRRAFGKTEEPDYLNDPPQHSTTFLLGRDKADIHGDKFQHHGLLSDIFGYSVALSRHGDHLVIGAIGGDGTFRTDCGVARVFEWTKSEGQWEQYGSDLQWFPGEEEWQQIGTDLEGNSIGDMFGVNVAISGDGSVVGVSSISGYLDIFYSTDEGQILKKDETIEIGTPLLSISSDGSRFVACTSNDSITQMTELTLFERSSSGWNVIARKQIDFPSSLDLNADGTRVVVGTAMNNTTSEQVVVMDYKDGEWHQVGVGISGDADELLGFETQITGDGTRLVVGGRLESIDERWIDFARAYEWSYLLDDWVQAGSDILDAPHNGGISLSMDGSIVVLGNRMGGFQVFESISTSDWTKVIFAEEETQDDFGSSVSVSFAPKKENESRWRIAVGSSISNLVRTFSLSCFGLDCPTSDFRSFVSLLDSIHHETTSNPAPSLESIHEAGDADTPAVSIDEVTSANTIVPMEGNATNVSETVPPALEAKTSSLETHNGGG